MITFGPVPSRRLGRSLGINNIPPKTCSYSCIYCQVGFTRKCTTRRKNFHETGLILQEVEERLQKEREKGLEVDYCTFVADGEPTLDTNLGEMIRGLKKLQLQTAVITNSSLLWNERVCGDLIEADWVSCKIDSTNEKTWRTINKPHRLLSLPQILDALLHFRTTFMGTFVTETMLVSGINDSYKSVSGVAAYLDKLQPDAAYISVPTRPPAQQKVKPPADELLIQAYQLFSQQNGKVECLTAYEGNDFASTGDITEDILSITSVHPMRQTAIQELLDSQKESWLKVKSLVDSGLLKQIDYRGNTYYLRR